MTQAEQAPARAAGTGVLFATCISALVVNANTSAVSILLPAISDDTGTSVADLQWAVTGYSLVGAATIVTAGALGDVFGRRRVFLAGLALFVVSCVLIALSQHGGAVVAGRMIQGAAGSTILACGMSLLSVASTGTQQVRAVSLWGAASAVGAAAGPLVGGVLVGSTGWQGLFWIDAAIAALCIPVTMRTVAESRDAGRPRSIDLLGTLLVATMLAPLILALTEGSDWGWASPATLGCLLLSALSVIGFVVAEGRVKAPLVDLQLLRNRVLVGATLAILIAAGTVNALMFVLSLFFQASNGLGFSPTEAGLATLPATMAMVAITPLIPRLTGRRGAARVIAGGFVLMSLGFLVLAFVGDDWGYAAFVGPLVVLAAGVGFANGPASSVSTSAVSADQVGAASGISNMARYVGAAVVTAAAAAIYASVTADRVAEGLSESAALATAVSRVAVLFVVLSVLGVVVAVMVAGHRALRRPHAAVAASGASTTGHTVHVHA